MTLRKKHNIAITSLLLIVSLRIPDTLEKYECLTVQCVIFSSHWFLIEWKSFKTFRLIQTIDKQTNLIKEQTKSIEDQPEVIKK